MIKKVHYDGKANIDTSLQAIAKQPKLNEVNPENKITCKFGQIKTILYFCKQKKKNMTTTIIRYNPQNTIVSSCLDFLSTLKDVEILSKTEEKNKRKLSANVEKQLFFEGSKRSMSKHFEKYLQ